MEDLIFKQKRAREGDNVRSQWAQTVALVDQLKLTFLGAGDEFAKHKVLVRRVNEWVCGKVKGVSDHYIWIAWGSQGRYRYSYTSFGQPKPWICGTSPANFYCLHIARCLISPLSCGTHLHSVAIEIQPMEERQQRLP